MTENDVIFQINWKLITLLWSNLSIAMAFKILKY